jgi:hypothetical protein
MTKKLNIGPELSLTGTQADMQKPSSSLAVLAENLRKFAKIHMFDFASLRTF